MEWEVILKGVPNFLLYLGLGFGLLVAYFVIYLAITHHDEMKLIRSGNSAAALSLAGAIIGFMLPLAIVIASHATLLRVAFWGIVALIVQVIAYYIASALMPGMSKQIEDGKVSVGAFSGLVSLAIGILNAACQIE